jgi:seryl-tRNA synthetase
MRYLVLVALIGCGTKTDNQIKELQDKVKQSQVQSDSVQGVASEDNKKVITKTVNTIVTLKQEVKELKTELNEVKAKLDSANSVDTNSTKFKFRPIGS